MLEQHWREVVHFGVARARGSNVGDLKIEIWDATGNKKVPVEVPDDVPIERVMVVLVERLHLPRHSVDGQLISYKLHHRRLGVQLLNHKGLAEQDVQDDDVLRIQPEITAGCPDLLP